MQESNAMVFIVNTIKEKIQNHYYYELIEDIFVNIKQGNQYIPAQAFVTVKLQDKICFAPHFLKNTREYWMYLDEWNECYQSDLQRLIFDIKKDMNVIDIYHAPLILGFKDGVTDDQLIQSMSYWADLLFNKKCTELSKPQQSFVFAVIGNEFISSGDELIEYLENFIFIQKHFPFYFEKLYKAYEYSIHIGMLTEEQIIKIEELKNITRKDYSQQCLNKLINFCATKKRWFYRTEKEMISCIKSIYKYYRYGWYNEQECLEIDQLFKIYANNESKGELAVNTYLVKLGYDIEKQFTFENCRDQRKLPFDTKFCVDGTLCLVEFDGEQHFNSIDYFGGDEYLKYVQFHDKIKNEYCETHNIPLLRIRYDEIDKIEEIIDRFINSIKQMAA